MADGLAALRAPGEAVYRVGRSPDPFAPPERAYAQPDGTFGGRFDDPAGRRGVPQDRRFRTLYFASRPAGAFGEVLARFRLDLVALAALGPAAPARSTVPADWRAVRRLGAARLDPDASFVDIGDAQTLAVLRPILAATATAMGLPDVDISAIAGPSRALTQEAARHIYERHGQDGQPRYAGIRYTSRLDRTWDCWAVFSDRIRYRVVRVDAIAADDPAVLEAARVLDLLVL